MKLKLYLVAALFVLTFSTAFVTHAQTSSTGTQTGTPPTGAPKGPPPTGAPKGPPPHGPKK